MLAYSALLTAGLVLSAPWWLLRMLTTSRYREGLAERLGAVPSRLFDDPDFALKGVVWIHTVSVGEVLAATQLVAELETAFGEDWSVVISTTTRTGQALARQRFGAQRVFYMPLDFGFAVRPFLRALRPAALILMESELWPRMLDECKRMGVPVAVVNARVSDRSFARAMRVKWLWSRVLRGVSLWLAQSEEDARRLVAMGASAESVRSIGNLKYDVRVPEVSRVAALIKEAAAGRPIVVAGSTVDRSSDRRLNEEEVVIQAWEGELRRERKALLVVAPRHPERFADAEVVAMEFHYAMASDWAAAPEGTPTFAKNAKDGPPAPIEVIVLDTIGDLAAVYRVADVAFVGGSLVKRGGHNPLEPAQFGVPVVMGPSYENFRDVVARMKAVDGIAIVGEAAGLSAAAQERASGRDDTSEVVGELEETLVRLLTNRDAARAMGERGRRVFEEQQGATKRAVEAIVGMVRSAAPGAKAPDSALPAGPKAEALGYPEAETSYPEAQRSYPEAETKSVDDERSSR
jgi:3-deoxy-D-manno-octulosonic-acid transferase